MPISSTQRKVGPTPGNGTSRDFPFTFKVFDVSEVDVIRTSANGGDVSLAQPTDYVVTLNPDQNAQPGGSVRLSAALGVGLSLTILSAVPITQLSNWQSQGGFNPDDLDDDLDRQTAVSQQLAEQLGRTLVVPATVSDEPIQMAKPVGDALLAWSADGTRVINIDPASLASHAAYSSSEFDVFTGDGVETIFNLSLDAGSLANLRVSIAGVAQTPGEDFQWNGGTEVEFAEPPADGLKIVIQYFAVMASSAELNVSVGEALAAQEAAEAAAAAALAATINKTDRDAGNLTLPNIQSYRGRFALDDRVRIGGLDFQSAGGIEAQLMAAASDAGVPANAMIVAPRGATFDYRGAASQTFPNKPLDVDFSGGRIIPANSVNTFIARNGYNVFRNGRVVPVANQTANAVFVLAGQLPKIINFHSERHFRFVDIVSGNGAEVECHLIDTVANGEPIRIGNEGYCGPVTLKTFMRANPAYDDPVNGGIARCGVLMQRADVVSMVSNVILQHRLSVLVEPDGAASGSDGKFSAIIDLTGATLDTARAGVVVRPVNAGQARRLSIIGGQISVMTIAGVLLDAAGGVVDEIYVDGARIQACANSGVLAQSGVQGVFLGAGNRYYANGTGVNLSGATEWDMIGGRFKGNTTDYVLPTSGGFWRAPRLAGNLIVTHVSGALTIPLIGVGMVQLSNGGNVTSMSNAAEWAGKTISILCSVATSFVNSASVRVPGGVTVNVPAEGVITFASNGAAWYKV